MSFDFTDLITTPNDGSSNYGLDGCRPNRSRTTFDKISGGETQHQSFASARSSMAWSMLNECITPPRTIIPEKSWRDPWTPAVSVIYNKTDSTAFTMIGLVRLLSGLSAISLRPLKIFTACPATRGLVKHESCAGSL
ncbi:unnamed protein product [Phytophthora fragariaefolia]|uniref:Unnamed protein product n=1 Tax=Phytophthora fragariaefolia TaxID=1490495 RepID=A0A9W6TVK8_9STRA|nr:unnamed protein product [Phytophthora fragariaefolia]